MRKIALFGYSGHSFVVADAIRQSGSELVGYYDKAEAGVNPFGIAYLGHESSGQSLDYMNQACCLAIAGVGDNNIRKKITEFLTHRKIDFATVIHPGSILSPLAIIGKGTFVAPGVKVNPLARIGAGVILNTGSIIEHECEVNNFAHIAPGAVLAGNVSVGEGSFIGANSVVLQGITIGKNVIIGAGSVVVKNVPDNEVWVGNPARKLIK